MVSKRTNRNKNIKRTKRTSRVEDGNSFIAKTPMWQFRRNDKDHFKWSIRRCCNFNEDVMDKLHDFEGQTWEQIINTNGKDTNHYVDVKDLIKDAQNRLLELKIYEDSLFSLRLTGKRRLYGLLEDGVFNIIWYDPEHEIYPSKKKHT